MNYLTKFIDSVDAYQRNHKFLGFIYSIIKKYGQDKCSYQSAVLTYYGFLSLFPLLVILTSLTKLLLNNNSSLRQRILSSTVHYFPIVGNQVQQSIHSSTETGLALIISLIIILYGAKGIANTLQYSISSLWYVPQFKMPSFLSQIYRSLSMIVVGGVGFLFASIASSLTVISGHTVFVRLLSSIFSLVILWITFILIFKLAIGEKKQVKEVILGAAITAIGLEILQTIGGLVMVNELKGLASIYGTFALVVGLLFWIYLQAQVILYAVEVDVVRTYQLYPRSIQGKPTSGDKLAYLKQAEASRQKANEKVAIK